MIASIATLRRLKEAPDAQAEAYARFVSKARIMRGLLCGLFLLFLALYLSRYGNAVPTFIFICAALCPFGGMMRVDRSDVTRVMRGNLTWLQVLGIGVAIAVFYSAIFFALFVYLGTRSNAHDASLPALLAYLGALFAYVSYGWIQTRLGFWPAAITVGLPSFKNPWHVLYAIVACICGAVPALVRKITGSLLAVMLGCALAGFFLGSLSVFFKT